jgi:hypothetical protein
MTIKIKFRLKKKSFNFPYFHKNLKIKCCLIVPSYEGLMRMRNFVTHPKGIMWIEGVWEKCWWEYLDIRRKYANRGKIKLRNEKLHNYCSSTNIIRVVRSRWVREERHLSQILRIPNSQKMSTGKPERKVVLRRFRHMW